MQPLISLDSPTLRWIGVTLANPYASTVPEGVTVVAGANGSGKATLANIICKGWNIGTNKLRFSRPGMSVKLIEFNDIHSLTGLKAEYYQQRLEATMNDEVPKVSEIMGEATQSPGWKTLCEGLRLHDIIDKRVNYLSSGELRKLLVVNALVDAPDLLILDNPYIGLDAASRELFNDTLDAVSRRGTSVLLLLCNPEEIPPFTTALIPMRGLTVGATMYRTRGDIEPLRDCVRSLMDYAVDLDAIPVRANEPLAHDVTFELRNVNVSYGKRQILRDVDWKVNCGECWALAGPNGAGKSLLLSLICADNPQAYSNDITIFDRRRGSGESIWDIKKRIGYVSPEMHLYFRSYGTLVDTVAQSLRSTSGNYGTPTAAERELSMRWLRLFHLEGLAQRRYSTLSAGEQRMALIARTLIKQPELLIMDEPLHGLDAARKRAVRAVINELVRRNRHTLVYVTHYLPEVPECVTHTKTLEKL